MFIKQVILATAHKIWKRLPYCWDYYKVDGYSVTDVHYIIINGHKIDIWSWDVS